MIADQIRGDALISDVRRGIVAGTTLRPEPPSQDVVEALVLPEMPAEATTTTEAPPATGSSSGAVQNGGRSVGQAAGQHAADAGSEAAAAGHGETHLIDLNHGPAGGVVGDVEDVDEGTPITGGGIKHPQGVGAPGQQGSDDGEVSTDDPVIEPTDPVTEPTDPVTEPTDPTDPVTEPTDPTEPVTEPTEPTDPTTEPTDGEGEEPPAEEPAEPATDVWTAYWHYYFPVSGWTPHAGAGWNPDGLGQGWQHGWRGRHHDRDHGPRQGSGHDRGGRR